MRIQANLNNVKDIEPLPTGVYSCYIDEEPKLVESPQKKTPGLRFSLVLTDPACELAPGVPRRMQHTIYKSAEFGWEHFKMKEIVEACGVKFDETGFNTEDFVNAELKIAVAQEAYKADNGEERIRNVIERFLKA